jgi:hypothetical protein
VSEISFGAWGAVNDGESMAALGKAIDAPSVANGSP